MKISVIIPALNEAVGILPCLQSVKNQEGEFELIVVDGGSGDGTVEVAQPHARVICSKQGRAPEVLRARHHSSTADEYYFGNFFWVGGQKPLKNGMKGIHR